MEHHGGGFFRVLGKIVLGVFIAALIAVAVGALVMVLWNWLMPAIFGLGTITYWQGFGLVLLMRLLIGGFGEHGMKGPGAPGKPGKPGAPRNASKHWYHSQHAYRGSHFDDVYEQWWQNEGAESFDQYMKERGKKEEPETKNEE